jgi:glycosyltransferase involved in cell wall biosynthesis
MLESYGVRIAGWVPQSELFERLGSASVYFHTAEYEGACLSILDSAAMGLPAVARPVPGVAEIDWMTMVMSPAEAAAEIAKLADPVAWAQASERSLQGVAGLTNEVQSAQLHAAYSMVRQPSASVHPNPTRRLVTRRG